MKKMWNVFWVETKRTMNRISFFLLILTVAVMCLLIPILLDDGRTMMNCLSAFWSMSKEEFGLQESLKVRSVLWQLTSGYFVMFTPMLVSFSVLPILCEEKESGALRYMMFRSGKKQAVIGSFFACILCGGVLMAAGYLLFAGILGAHSYVLFGSAGLQTIKEVSIFVCNKTIGVFAFGMTCAVWTYLVSAFVQNRYLLVSIPYIALWFLQRLAGNIQYEVIEENAGVRLYVQTFGATYVFGDLKYVLQIISIYGVISVFIILLHMGMLKRGTDCGM